MKKAIIVLVIFLSGIIMYGQAKKPTIMVVPSDNWCVTRGYVQTYNNQGKDVVTPDYKAALQNDSACFPLLASMRCWVYI